MDLQIINNILVDIIEERSNQFEKWGDQKHSFYKWMNILMEEVGEACQIRLHIDEGLEDTIVDLRKELIQVIAVGVQIVEQIDQGFL